MKPIATLDVLLSLQIFSPLVVSDATATKTTPDASAVRAGTNFITTRVFSAEEDERVLKAFEGLRVADVCNGMDAVGLHNRGLMNGWVSSPREGSSLCVPRADAFRRTIPPAKPQACPRAI